MADTTNSALQTVKLQAQPAAFLVTNLPSGEPSLCFEDERGDYGNEQFTPVFEPLYLAAPAQAAIDAREQESTVGDGWLLDSEGCRLVGASHHYTAANIKALIWELKALEDPRMTTQADFENRDWRAWCGTLHRILSGLASEVPLGLGDAAPAPAAAGGVTDAFTAAYMAACKGRAPDHNEIGLHYFRAGAALAQSVPVQPSNGCEVNEYSSRVCERGTRSCTASHEAAPVQQEALQEAHRLGFLRAAGWMQCDKLFADVNGSTYRKDRDHDVATIALTPPAVAAPAQAGETKGDA
jgi:hypothetical protein